MASRCPAATSIAVSRSAHSSTPCPPNLLLGLRRDCASVSPRTQDWHTAQPAQRVRVAASRGSAGTGSRGQRWAFAVMAGAQPREILGSRGAITPESRRGPTRRKGGVPMSNTSQGLLQRRRDAVGTDWRNYAACHDVDPELFFPLGTSGASLLQIEEAKQICRTCPVCGPCLRWALDSGDAGVWGGTTEDERRIHRQLRTLRG